LIEGETVGLLKSVFQETFGTILKHLFGQCGTRCRKSVIDWWTYSAVWILQINF